MKKSTIPNEERCQEIIKYYLEPHTLRNTFEHFKICKRLMLEILTTYNIRQWTPEEAHKIGGLQIHRATQAMSPEARKAHGEKISNSKKAQRIEKTDEEKQAIIDFYLAPNTLSTTVKHFHTINEVVIEILNKANISLWTAEQNSEINKLHHQQIWTNMSEEEKQKRCQKISNAKKTAWQNKSEEEKLAFSESRHRVEQSRTKEERAAIVEKGRQTQKANWAKKSEEEKAEHARKTSEALQARSDEEKQQTKEKRKQTFLDRYGVENPLQCQEIHEKYEQTMIEKYGVENPLKNTEIRRKSQETKIERGTVTTSQPEENLYQYLCDIYSADNVLRQYRDEERYPFNCDFYIKSDDLFIELNGNWTHGEHKFDQTNLQDQQIVEAWKSKNSSYYDDAIDTWTVRDINKFKTAEENNLNYKAIYWDEYEKLLKGEIPWTI